MGEAGFAAQPTIANVGELPDTFLISARDPLPLRLCTFASLRSFLPVARSLREIHCPKCLTRGHLPHPPRPLPPSKPGGEGGAKRLWEQA